MELYIVLSICIAAEFVFVPLFLKVSWPQPSVKSLILKMICATLFVAVGVISLFISGNYSQYAYTMLIGLAFGWVGDFFLHVKSTNFCFVTGFFSFLIGHIVYIVAYVNALKNLYPEYSELNIAEIAVTLLFCIGALVSAKFLNVKFPTAAVKIGIGGYFIMVVSMFTKATALGLNFMKSGGEYGAVALIVLSLGSLCFVVSDALLGFIMFSENIKKFPLKVANIVTYFAGQVMLASSILFIKG